MLRTTKNMKCKYEKIQNCLFDLIPEKWDEIYLYASVVDKHESVPAGEMYFYYIPRSILKKKPVNVYEVPKRFNINESEYLKMVDSLYQTIKDLRQDFIDTEQNLWTNLTISIAHCRFKVEFYYNPISQEEYASYVRHVIWRYKYLHLDATIKEEKRILEKYFKNEQVLEEQKEEYQAGMYLKNVNNVVGFEKEIEAKQERMKEQELKAEEQEEKRKKKIQEKAKKAEAKRMKEQEKNKNQILNM